MSRHVLSAALLIALLSATGEAFASPAAPGDTSSTVTLFANFDGDVIGAAPNLALPSAPAGDHLTLNSASGAVLVNAQIGGLTMAAQMKQQSGIGGVSLSGWPAAPPPGTEKVTVGWRSVAQDDNPTTIIACSVRGSNGNVIASVHYGAHGGLTWNSLNGTGQSIPLTYRQNRSNAFQLVIDLLASRVSLLVDGAPVSGFQDVPFAEAASDVARVSFEALGTSPQTFAIDDVFAAAFARSPNLTPAVTAPPAVSGAENAAISFSVNAGDPDGEPITSLTASPLPAGASFAASASSTSGTFLWTPDFTQAGFASVTFTATNSLSGSATTAITVANVDRAPLVSAPPSAAVEELGHIDIPVSASDPDADAIAALAADLSGLPSGHTAMFLAGTGNASGTLSWSPAVGEAGVYMVTFRATAGGAVSSASTNVFVAALGTSVTGRFIWTPRAGSEGSYTITFVATDLDGSSSLDVPLTVLPPTGLLAAPAPARGAPAPGALAPEAPMKGPVISIDGVTTTKSGNTMTLTSTATSSTNLLAARLAAAPTASRAAAAGVITLGADLTGLPAGNDAVFILDQDPVISAPAAVEADAGALLTVHVSSGDPDGDVVATFTADLSALPAGNGAAFTTNAALSFGTLTWTPATSDTGSYAVTFQATNRLVGTASTLIHVRPAAATRLFVTSGKKLVLGSGKPLYSLQIEPMSHSFDLMNLDLSSIVMISQGTGSVSQIGASSQKQMIIGDRDNNLIQDVTVSFAKADLRNLFSLLRGNVTVTVNVEGSLVTGGRFRGTLAIPVSAGSGKLAASVIPNPLNPEGMLRFVTARPGQARVRLYDAAGRLVRELMPSAHVGAGEHTVTIRAEDGAGRRLASGIYFFRVDAPEGASVGRVAVLK
jgi:hypothetical protein